MHWVWYLLGTQPWSLGWLAEKLFFPVLITSFVYKFAVLQLRKKREIDFAEKQLAEFYAPMLGAYAEILNHTKFDQYMKDASLREHSAQLGRYAEQWNPDQVAADTPERLESLEHFFDNINDRLWNERISAYVDMRELFAKKMAYADLDTRRWYDYFYAFVEMWRVIVENKRLVTKFLTRPVQNNLGQMFDEGLLQPFYEHLSQRCDYLQREIAGGRGDSTKFPAPPPPTLGSPNRCVTMNRGAS